MLAQRVHTNPDGSAHVLGVGAQDVVIQGVRRSLDFASAAPAGAPPLFLARCTLPASLLARARQVQQRVRRPPPPLMRERGQAKGAPLALLKPRRAARLAREDEGRGLHGLLQLPRAGADTPEFGPWASPMFLTVDAAHPGLVRGHRFLEPTGRTMLETTRPEFLDDFRPYLVKAAVGLGGSRRPLSMEQAVLQRRAGCGFLALHRWGGLLHTAGLLEGSLFLSDLQADYEPNPGGPALRGIKRRLKDMRAEPPAAGSAASFDGPAVRMLMGCEAWTPDGLARLLRGGEVQLLKPRAAARDALAGVALAAHTSKAEALDAWDDLLARGERPRDGDAALLDGR